MLNKFAIVSTFPPTQCGIATYASDLIQGWYRSNPRINISTIELTHDTLPIFGQESTIRVEKAKDYKRAANYINSSDIGLVDIQHEYKIYGSPDGANIDNLLDLLTKPIFATLHTVNESLNKERSRNFYKILSLSKGIFVFSNYAKHLIVKNYDINPEKILVIPHGVPQIKFIKPENKINKETYTFLSAGHMRETKGYELAIRSLHWLKTNHHINFHYIIVGADHPQNKSSKAYRKELISLIKKLKLESNITFVNDYIPQSELINLIQSSDICLTPYTSVEQSSSGILALMVACGRPVVSTPFQFASSTIAMNSGFHSKDFSFDGFKNAIEEALNNKMKWDSIMQFNYNLGKSWEWKVVANMYFSHYSKLM